MRFIQKANSQILSKYLWEMKCWRVETNPESVDGDYICKGKMRLSAESVNKSLA